MSRKHPVRGSAASMFFAVVIAVFFLGVSDEAYAAPCCEYCWDDLCKRKNYCWQLLQCNTGEPWQSCMDNLYPWFDECLDSCTWCGVGQACTDQMPPGVFPCEGAAQVQSAQLSQSQLVVPRLSDVVWLLDGDIARTRVDWSDTADTGDGDKACVEFQAGNEVRLSSGPGG